MPTLKVRVRPAIVSVLVCPTLKRRMNSTCCAASHACDHLVVVASLLRRAEELRATTGSHSTGPVGPC